MWDAKTNTIMHSLHIPRAVSLLAGTVLTDENYKNGKLSFEVSANINDKDWGIIQSPFMREKALTKGYLQKITIENGELSCDETTMLEIYGIEFEHTDKNILTLQK